MRGTQEAHLESISAIGPSEKKLLMMVRKLLGDELNKNMILTRLNYLEKAIEKCEVRRTMSEILDYVRTMTLGILLRKIIP